MLWLAVAGVHQSVGRGGGEWKIAACRRESKGAWNPPKGAKRSGVGLGVHGAMASFRLEYRDHRSGEAQLKMSPMRCWPVVRLCFSVRKFVTDLHHY